MRTLDEIVLAENERRAIEAATDALRALFPIADIVLFGSKARGDSDPESDIDLLVLTDRRLDRNEEQTIGQALFDIGLRFDVIFGPLILEAKEWRQGVHSVLPIHAEVEREGVRCLDRTPPPGSASDGAAVPREVLVEQAVDEWMTKRWPADKPNCKHAGTVLPSTAPTTPAGAGARHRLRRTLQAPPGRRLHDHRHRCRPINPLAGPSRSNRRRDAKTARGRKVVARMKRKRNPGYRVAQST